MLSTETPPFSEGHWTESTNQETLCKSLISPEPQSPYLVNGKNNTGKVKWENALKTANELIYERYLKGCEGPWLGARGPPHERKQSSFSGWHPAVTQEQVLGWRHGVLLPGLRVACAPLGNLGRQPWSLKASWPCFSTCPFTLPVTVSEKPGQTGQGLNPAT